MGTETGGGEMRFQHSNSSDRDDTVLFFQIYPETSTTSPSQTSLPFARAGPRGVPAPRTSSGSSRPLSRTRRRGPTAPASSRSSLPSLCCRRPSLRRRTCPWVLGTLVGPRNSQPPCRTQTVKKKAEEKQYQQLATSTNTS